MIGTRFGFRARSGVRSVRDLCIEFRRFASLCLLGLTLACVTTLRASGEQGPEAWLPEGTILFGRIDASDRWLEHPVVESLKQSEAFKKLWRTPEALQLRGGITVAEFALGMKLDRLANSLSTHGMYVAIDKETKGIAVLLHTEGEAWLEDYIEKAIGFLRKDAKSKGNHDPVKEAMYRDFRGYKIQNAVFAQVGDWLVLSNEGETLKAILDRKLDRGPSLSDADWYRRSISEVAVAAGDKAGDTAGKTGSDTQSDTGSKTDSEARGFVVVDWKSVRELARGNDLFRGQAKDFGAELLLGGWLSVFSKADVASVTMELDRKGLALKAWAPSETEWFGDSRLHYVGPQAKGRAPGERLQGDLGVMASLGTYRDFSQLWLRAGDLFDQNVNDQLAQADATLTTLFSGKDFGEDILGAIYPEVRLVVCEPTASDDTERPALRLPGFALVGRMKDPGKLQRELKRTFQTFIGFLNVAGAQEGQPQLELENAKEDRAMLYWAHYVRDEDKDYSGGLPIQFNFEPSIAFVDDLVVVSSQLGLAKELGLKLSGEGVGGTTESSEHQTWMNLDMAALRRLLDLNSNALIAQSMLENGKTRVEAKRDLERVSTLMELVERVRMSMQFEDRAVIEFRVDFPGDFQGDANLQAEEESAK